MEILLDSHKELQLYLLNEQGRKGVLTCVITSLLGNCFKYIKQEVTVKNVGRAESGLGMKGSGPPPTPVHSKMSSMQHVISYAVKLINGILEVLYFGFSCTSILEISVILI